MEVWIKPLTWWTTTWSCHQVVFHHVNGFFIPLDRSGFIWFHLYTLRRKCLNGWNSPVMIKWLSNLYISPTDPPENVILTAVPAGDVTIGSSVTFTCSSNGSHPPIHDYRINKDDTGEVVKENTMTISNIQPSHSGTYFCYARNSIDRVRSPSVTVNVQCEFLI